MSPEEIKDIVGRLVDLETRVDELEELNTEIRIEYLWDELIRLSGIVDDIDYRVADVERKVE